MQLSDRFIKASDMLSDFGRHVPAPYFRRSFTLDFKPETAEITVTGLGFYCIFVNGKDITKSPLAPYISNPDDIVYYDTYDLAPYLVKGENVLGFVLGNGLRNPFGGFVWDFHKAPFIGPLVLALDFCAAGEGKSLAFEADESFRTHPSPIRFDELRMGCRYDAREEVPGWNLPGFDDSAWDHAQKAASPKGMKKLCTASPIIVETELTPVSVSHYDELPFCYESTLDGAKPIKEAIRQNVYVFDFGRNTAGVTVLRVKGERGQKITIRHGEYLQDGDKFSIFTTLFPEPDRIYYYLEYGQTDEYILKGGEEEIFVPVFKYDGFRFAYVDGLTAEQAARPDVLTYRVYHGDFKLRSTFSSSSETLNKLFAMARNADGSNFLWFPTDCPHREKNGWTGDASMSAEHMLYNFDCAASLREWLTNIRAAQNEKGALPGIIPTGGWGFHWGNGPVWDSVIINLPLEIFRHTGDIEAFVENIPMIDRYFAYAETRLDENGLAAYGLGDWMDPFQSVHDGKIAAPLEVTDTLMLMYMTETAALLYGIANGRLQTGHTAERDRAEKLHDRLWRAFRKHLIDFDTMTVAGDCQTSQAFAIFAGAFTPSELPAARERLLSIIHRDGDVIATGMIGLRYMFRVLIDMGEAELAYRMITSETRTGYGFWVKQGHTAMLENFVYPGGKEVNSLNHHFLGDIFAVMIQSFAGITYNPALTDRKQVWFTPRFPDSLTHAEASFDSDFGKVAVEWHRDGDAIRLTATMPEGMNGFLRLHDGMAVGGRDVILLSAGENVFDIRRA